MNDNFIYLDTYVLQQDMRIRLPRAILANMNVEKGKTNFDIYLNSDKQYLLLRIHSEHEGNMINDVETN